MPTSSSAGAISLVNSSAWRVTSSSIRALIARSCWSGSMPSGRLGADAGGDLLLQPGDAHLDELVEVGREDREELRPLEQRALGVLGEGEHPGVEVEPGELPVQEPVLLGGVVGRAPRGASYRWSAPRRSGAASVARPRARSARGEADRAGRIRGGHSNRSAAVGDASLASTRRPVNRTQRPVATGSRRPRTPGDIQVNGRRRAPRPERRTAFGAAGRVPSDRRWPPATRARTR